MPTGVVIGIGNRYRRDDGFGPAVAQRVARHQLPGVRVLTAVGEPTEMLDAWTGIERAVVIDAVTGPDAAPGRVRRWAAPDLRATAGVSSHAWGLAQTCALGAALGRLPGELILYTVDAADTGDGPGLSSAVAAAVPVVVTAVLAELRR